MRDLLPEDVAEVHEQVDKLDDAKLAKIARKWLHECLDDYKEMILDCEE